MGHPWRWGALPGEKRDGGALCRLLADAVSDAKLCPGPDTYKRVGFRAGRVFRMRARGVPPLFSPLPRSFR